MKLNDYQIKAEYIANRSPSDTDTSRFLNFSLGLAGEAAEICDLLISSESNNLKMQNFKFELGDLMWYVAVFANTLKIPLEDITPYQLSSNVDADDIMYYKIGLRLAKEAGDVCDLIKKSVFQGHKLDTQKLKNELFDVMTYISKLAQILDISLEEVADDNISKLIKRYPSRFDTLCSVNNR